MTLNMKNKVFEYLDKLQQNSIIKISQIAKNNSELFIKYLKEYIDQGGHITVSNDWTEFKKHHNPNSFKFYK